MTRTMATTTLVTPQQCFVASLRPINIKMPWDQDAFCWWPCVFYTWNVHRGEGVVEGHPCHDVINHCLILSHGNPTTNLVPTSLPQPDTSRIYTQLVQLCRVASIEPHVWLCKMWSALEKNKKLGRYLWKGQHSKTSSCHLNRLIQCYIYRLQI